MQVWWIPITGSRDTVGMVKIPQIKILLRPWKWGKGHQNLISSYTCPTDISMHLVTFHQLVQKISWVKWKFHIFKSYCDLENEVKVTKIESALKLVSMIYPCKFGEIPPIGSKDIMGTRSGMLTPTGSHLKLICPLSPPVGDITDRD